MSCINIFCWNLFNTPFLYNVFSFIRIIITIIIIYLSVYVVQVFFFFNFILPVDFGLLDRGYPLTEKKVREVSFLLKLYFSVNVVVVVVPRCY